MLLAEVQKAVNEAVEFARREIGLKDGIKEETLAGEKCTVIEGAAFDFIKTEVARALRLDKMKLSNARSTTPAEMARTIFAYNFS